MINLRSSRQQAAFISILCCLVYFTSYLTRVNYSAALVELAQSLHLSNQIAGMAVIGLFITYGIGQPICGFLGDRIEPRTMIFTGLVATALCNFTIAFMSNIYWITIVWCLNGFFQAMLWPPLVRFMTGYLSPELYRKAIVGITAASSTGTIMVYLLVPLSIWISSWRLAFVIPSIAAFVVAFIWLYSVKGLAAKRDSMEEPRSEQPTTRSGVGSLIMLSGLLPIMLVIILQGALRDGITTWMPTYVNDVFQLGTSISILSGAVLPLFTILFVYIAAHIYKCVPNELTTSAILWGAGLVAGSILIWTFASHAMISILLMALLTGCMHGINLMLLSNLPMHFAKYGRASTMSGVLNGFTYVGSAISIYGVAALSEAYGWRVTILCWTIIVLIGLVICIGCMKRWRSFTDMTVQAGH